MGDEPLRIETGKEYALVEYQARDMGSGAAGPNRPAREIRLVLKVKFEDHPPADPGSQSSQPQKAQKR